jgi:glycosyltransferase involved in cell wall biosynthesis
MMHILIVTHVVAKNDGQGRVNYEIVHKALRAGFRVTLLATRVDPALAAHPGVRWVSIKTDKWPTKLLKYQIFALKSAAWIRRHRSEFDIVHVNGFISWAASDVNSVHFVHSGWYRCGFYPFAYAGGPYALYQILYTRLNGLLEKWAFRHARMVVPVSRKVASEIAALDIAVPGMTVIHNGVDIEEFRPGPSLRQVFGLPEDRFILLFAGDLRISRKNLDTVLRALADTPEHTHLAVAGFLKNSPYPALVKSLGLQDRVHFLDLVQDMPNLMRSVDAFVFPSRYEAMSLVLLEALASGLPVLTARTAGGAEVIEPGCGVVLEHPDDHVALAASIASIATDPARARAMGAAARELAATLSWDAMGERYMTLYAALAGQKL